MKYAIVKIGSSQFKVSEGDEISVEKLPIEKEKTIEFDQVLLLVDGKNLKVGQPYLGGITVKAKVIDQTKGKKVRVATYKAKSRYRRVIGHRKQITKIKIETIRAAKIAKTSPKRAKKITKTEPKKSTRVVKKPSTPKTNSSSKGK